MSAVLGTDFGKQVCDIFGLNPLIVSRMTLKIEPADLVTLDVQIIVRATHAAMLRDLMMKYELHEKITPTAITSDEIERVAIKVPRRDVKSTPWDAEERHGVPL